MQELTIDFFQLQRTKYLHISKSHRYINTSKWINSLEQYKSYLNYYNEIMKLQQIDNFVVLLRIEIISVQISLHPV